MKSLIIWLTLLLFACNTAPSGDKGSYDKVPDTTKVIDQSVVVSLSSGNNYVQDNDQNTPVLPQLKIVFSKNIDFSNLQSAIYLAGQDNINQHIELTFEHDNNNQVLVSPKIALAYNTDYILYISSEIKTLEGKFIHEKSFKFSTEDNNKLIAHISITSINELFVIDLTFNHPIVGYGNTDDLRIINISEQSGPIPLLIEINPQDHRQIKISTYFLHKAAQYNLLISKAIKDEITHNSVFNSKLEFTLPASTQISAKGDSTCAIYNNQTYCWGDNIFGQLGNGSKKNSEIPEIILPSTEGTTKFYGIVTLSDRHACGITYDNYYNISCWGNNKEGQLGTSDYIDYKIQHKIDMPTNINFYAITAGGFNTCAIGLDFKSYCWGRGMDGELGNSQYKNNSNKPVYVTMPRDVDFFRSISAGENHICAVADGKIYCWGANKNGELGDGTTKPNSNIPTQVAMPAIKHISAISAGEHHTCAIADGKIYCWGANESGQLGNANTESKSNIPVPVSISDDIIKNISAISAGDRHTCAIADGKIYCWGANESGQLGNGSYDNSNTPVPIKTVPEVKGGFVSISAGANHTCANSTINNIVYCWGSNASGQIGNGTHENQTTPIKVTFPK